MDDQTLHHHQEKSVATLLVEALKSSPQPYILTYLNKGGELGETRYTPSQLLAESAQYAERLRADMNGARTALLSMEPGCHFVIALLGCIFSGITAIPVPAPRSPKEMVRLQAIMSDSHTRQIICDANTLAYFQKETSDDDRLQLIHISIDANEVDSRAGAFIQEPTITPFISPHEPVIIQYTSGSTKAPRGVKVSERNILANQRISAEKWRFAPEKNMLSWLPHYHDMGLFGSIIYPLMTGMQCILMSPVDFIKQPLRWLSAVSKHRAAISGGPAFAYQLCLDIAPDDFIRGLDLSCWQAAYCGADYVPHQLLENVRKRFSAAGLHSRSVLACYGLAESTLYVGGEKIWEDLPEVFAQRSNPLTTCEGCYLGRTFDHIRILSSEGGKEQPPGETGKIYISSDSVTEGYVNAELPVFEENGRTWLDTGDIGFIKDNFLFITGREKDMVVIHGKNIFTNDLALNAANTINTLNPNACVLYKREPDHRLTMLIETKNKTAEFDEEQVALIKRQVFDEFGVSLMDVSILPRGSMPRTSSGKVQADLVRRSYAEQAV
ncbi:Acyl-CoA synthetases (AMP-forming)/AMP-acid ligases II [Hahella chejuensis KCTC 2396]|uniref:Acyl-CoA synthetases (AMP-forming)/AMP-acid ligases II n=1 Tax=Hahella chejuensis (strain KCTC 2396) TaxID=349521 RepID=Q2SG85_HAHCH|nr:AMP-binding protein [Hahella chejuensis]ABC30339.1 Acyl-CoA synthetases (AMP-forming)/AMP-acid ligases II [Hahella chejuensis KCTC 2396]